MMMETFWFWSDRVTIVLSLVAAVFSFKAWARTSDLIRANRLAAERRRAEITIRFRVKNAETGRAETLDLPYRPRRDQLSRAELTGIISFYYGQARFDPAILRQLMEDGQLSHVLAGDLYGPEDELMTIDCSEEMFAAIQTAIAQEASSAQASVPAPTSGDHAFTVNVVNQDAECCELRIGFSQPAENDRAVRDAAEAIRVLELPGGRLVKFDGPCSLPVAMVLAHAVAHRFAAVAVRDPKLGSYIVVISHDPALPVGTRI